jgi:hypothetical protein
MGPCSVLDDQQHNILHRDLLVLSARALTRLRGLLLMPSQVQGCRPIRNSGPVTTSGKPQPRVELLAGV